jgi:hypothetical protein
MSFDRGIIQQAADETRKADQADTLDADLIRAEIDQANRNHSIVYQLGMACVRREFNSEEGQP